MSAMLQQPNKKQKTGKTFWMVKDFDEQKSFVHLKDHYSGNPMPMLGVEGSIYDNNARTTCMAPVIYSSVGPSGNQGSCNGTITEPTHFTIDITKTLPDWFNEVCPGEQARLDNLFEWMHNSVDEHLELAWNTEDIFQKWKDKAMKEAKKKHKKEGGELKTIAKEWFKENATLSMFKEYTDENDEDQPRLHFRKKYATKAGVIQRPTMWRKDKESKKMVDFTDDVPFIAKHSIVKFDFQLNMYETPTMYGVQAQLNKNIVCVKLESLKKREFTEEDNSCDVPVFDF